MTYPRQNPEPAGSSPTPESNPRAFAIGTGYVFQTLGFVFSLSSCLLWAVSTRFMPPLRTDDGGLTLPGTMALLGVAISLIGGVGMVAAGVGMQGEKRHSGVVGMIVSGVMTFVYTALVVYIWLGAIPWPAAILPLLLALLCAILFMLAAHSASLLRRHPPPADYNVVTDEWIHAYRARRREQREEMTPSADQWDQMD